MALEATFNLVLLVSYAVLLATSTLCWIRAMASVTHWQTVLYYARSLWRMVPCLGGACGLHQRAVSADPLEAHVARKLLERRVARARFAFVLVHVVSDLLLTALVINIALGHSRHMTRYQDVLLIIGIAATNFVMDCSSHITARALDRHFSFLMMLCLLFVSPLATDAQYLREQGFLVLLGVFVLALVNLNVRVIAFWITLFCSMMCYTIMHGEFVCHEMTRLELTLDFFATGIIEIAAVGIIERTLAAQVRHEIKARTAQNELSAARGILDTVCDVIVELDANLRILEHVPKLAALLLLGPTRSLQGEHLEQYMAEDHDREEFARNMLVEPGRDGCRAHVFHTRMHDSNRSIIRVEIFSVTWQGLDGQRRYVLGMREFTDVPPILQEAAPVPLAAAGPRTPPPLPPLPALAGPRPRAPLQSPPPPPQEAPRRGTPRFAEPQDLRCASETSGSAAEGSEPGAQREGAAAPPPQRARVRTVAPARDLSLLAALGTWELGLPPSACCSKHVAILEAYKSLGRLQAHPCHTAITEENSWQCPTCGIMDDVYKRRPTSKQCYLCKMLLETGMWRAPVSL